LFCLLRHSPIITPIGVQRQALLTERLRQHVLYELETIDAVEIKHGRTLDQASIVWAERPTGYIVGDLANARACFTKVCSVPVDWDIDP
jgi:hypothetical protein